MTPNERIKAKQDQLINALKDIQNKVTQLEELAEYLGVDLCETRDYDLHDNSLSIGSLLSRLSKTWNSKERFVLGREDEVTS
jgi:hypothetical protein